MSVELSAGAAEPMARNTDEKGRAIVRRGFLGAGVGAALFAAFLVGPAVGFADVSWSVHGAAQPSLFAPASGDKYQLLVENVGSETSSGGLTLVDHLPAGLTLVGVVSFPSQVFESAWECAEPEVSIVRCTFPEGVPMGWYTPSLGLEVSAPAESAEPLVNRVEASGGGATVTATNSQTVHTGTGPQSFGIADFSLEARQANGESAVAAGGHPWQVTTSIGFPWDYAPANNEFITYGQVENVKKIVVELPVGMVGNPAAAARCTELQLFQTSCPISSRVGTIAIAAAHFPASNYESSDENNPNRVQGIYNMTSEPGYPAVFGFDYISQTVYIYASVVHSPQGERVRLTTVGVPPVLLTGDVVLTLFGEPGAFNGSESNAALITNPTECSASPPMARLEVDSWENPGKTYSSETPVFDHLTGCQGLQEEFTPKLALSPLLGSEGTTQADSPSGYVGTLKVPQDKGAFTETQTPEVRAATVALPAGMSINPAAGNGLVACQERGPEGINLGTGETGQWGADEGNPEATELGAGHAGGNASPYDDAEYHAAPGRCPKASTIGSVEVFTPLLEDRCGEPGQAPCAEGESPAPLQGHVYIAQPKCGGAGQPGCTGADAENGNLYSAYVELAGNGVLVKQPATLSANQTTGQLTLRVHEMPELPFSELKVHVHGGPLAPLATSQTCELETTTSAITPWSGGPDATLSSSRFSTDWDGVGGACPATDPFNPGFTGGTVSSAAGAFSPLTLTLTRQDREQNLSDLTETLPAGVLARIAGVEKCADNIAVTGACPPGSKIGTLTVAAGPGANPLYVHGDLYLTGGYKGGAFGEAAVIHAQAGPFNLGDVVVRGAIHIDPTTARATIVSDPFPQIIDGVPARVRTVNVVIDRPGFTFNPTNCSQLEMTGTVSAQQGAVVNVSAPFAAVNCAVLPFKPVFKAAVGGHASKANGASLDVRVSSKGGPQPGGGEANIAKVKVSLPKILPSRLETLHKACLAAVFEANPASCPAGANVGAATASTPVLANRLAGPAYLVSHGGQAFPDLDIVLQGEGITLILVGNTFISKAGITTSTFNTVPDAPVSSFELKLPAGPGSILGAYAAGKNHYNLCGQTLHMPTKITAQNGAVINTATKINVTGCPKTRKLRPQGRRRGRSSAHRAG